MKRCLVEWIPLWPSFGGWTWERLLDDGCDGVCFERFLCWQPHSCPPADDIKLAVPRSI